MRCFFAVEIPQQQRAAIAASLAALARKLPEAKWVQPDRLHITLKFLGELEEQLAQEAVAQLAELLRKTPREVPVRLGGGGFFPDSRRPRVAWLGGQAPGLAHWAQAAEEAGKLFGVPPENRGFSLHVTLARLSRPWPEGAVQRFLEEVGRWELPPFVAREIVLFESTLTPRGAIYTARARVAPGGAA